ncbi:MAG TPA: DUF2513 domain-containing protein [Candidatus Acidoferrales bacterium]|nr:DUF2513 domain-containing protein [Candidatus Acidoferrales bacterium]
MQVFECRQKEMTRDMDLIRDLLLQIEKNPLMDGNNWVSFTEPGEICSLSKSMGEIGYHLTLLVEEGFVKGNTTMEMPVICKLTWKGHELIDDIRDPGIWGKTKDRLKGLPTVAIGIIAEVAKAEIKKHIGLP